MQNTLIFPIMSITYIICIYIYILYRERDEDFRKLDHLILKPMILVIPHSKRAPKIYPNRLCSDAHGMATGRGRALSREHREVTLEFLT